MKAQRLPATDVGSIVEFVAIANGLEPAEVTAPGRRPSLVHARWTVALAMQLRGQSRQEIQALFGQDHATVSYGLAHVGHELGRVHLAHAAAGMADAEAVQGVVLWIRRMARYGVHPCPVIVRYYIAELLGCSVPVTDTAGGLIILASRPDVRRGVWRALEQAGFGGLLVTIRHYAKERGIRWVA